MLKYADCLLVIAEQASLCAAIAGLVLPFGYRVEIASSQKRAHQLLKEGQFAGAVVVAAGLTTDEFAFVRALQRSVPKLAVLTDDVPEAKRLAASLPEAMVCRSKRLDHEKLLAFLREAQPQASDSAGAPGHLHFAGCTLDVTGRIFRNADQQEVMLTRNEFALLVAFARNAGRVLSRAQLRNALDGGGAEAYDRSIDMLVARLRRKIEPVAAEPKFIVTLPGVGYKFVPRVHRGEPRRRLQSVNSLARARRRTPSAGKSRYWPARLSGLPRSPPNWIQKTWNSRSTPSTRPALKASRASAARRYVRSATACSPISATRQRRRTAPRWQCVRRSNCCASLAQSTPRRSATFQHASALRRARC
jgi:DNA-binding response OmpR family regulator